MSGPFIEQGTYRTPGGGLLHCWRDGTGALRAESEDPRGWIPTDGAALGDATKLSDDPFWTDGEGAAGWRSRDR